MAITNIKERFANTPRHPSVVSNTADTRCSCKEENNTYRCIISIHFISIYNEEMICKFETWIYWCILTSVHVISLLQTLGWELPFPAAPPTPAKAPLTTTAIYVAKYFAIYVLQHPKSGSLNNHSYLFSFLYIIKFNQSMQ